MPTLCTKQVDFSFSFLFFFPPVIIHHKKYTALEYNESCAHASSHPHELALSSHDQSSNPPTW